MRPVVKMWQNNQQEKTRQKPTTTVTTTWAVIVWDVRIIKVLFHSFSLTGPRSAHVQHSSAQKRQGGWEQATASGWNRKRKQNSPKQTATTANPNPKKSERQKNHPKKKIQSKGKTTDLKYHPPQPAKHAKTKSLQHSQRESTFCDCMERSFFSQPVFGVFLKYISTLAQSTRWSASR